MDFSKIKSFTIPEGNVKSLHINGVLFWSVESEPGTLSPGLYGVNNSLLASWDSLVNTYGMNCEVSYTSSNYDDKTTSPYYVLTNNGELANGKKMIIGNAASIGSYAFYVCTSLENITIPDSVTSIGRGAFSGCSSLENIIIPDSVTSINAEAFHNCSSLVDIILSKYIPTLGAQFFAGCTSLVSIQIPDSVTTIYSKVWYNCANLKRVDFSSHTAIPTLAGTDSFSGTHADLQIKAPASLIDSWKNATNWSAYADKIVTEFTNEV